MLYRKQQHNKVKEEPHREKSGEVFVILRKNDKNEGKVINFPHNKHQNVENNLVDKGEKR
jgi:hypothetical protein